MSRHNHKGAKAVIVTISAENQGQEPIKFKKGALHRALGVPEGEPIPEAKKRAALAGKFGPKVKKMAVLAFRGALKSGRETVEEHREGKRKESRKKMTKRKAVSLIRKAGFR